MTQGAGAVNPRSGKCGERLQGFLGSSVKSQVPLDSEDELSETHALGGKRLKIDPH